MKKIFYFLLISFLTFNFGMAQLMEFGQPFSKSLQLSFPSEQLLLPKMNNDELNQKYIHESIEKSFRFGHEIDVEVDVLANASVEKFENGAVLYRYAVKSKGALSLNFVFDVFDLKKGSLMYIFDAKGDAFTGAYSFLNVNVEKNLGTDVLKSDEVIIEIYEPKNNVGTSSVHLSKVVHGFRDVDSFQAKVLGSSGSCNYDVNCALGSDYQDQKNGVAMTISGGLACSGSLVNNTSGTIEPYYLTARHCGTSTSTWVLRFNWERDAANAICAQPNSTDNDGITTHTITGTELKASSGIADFTLVKLNYLPDLSWNVYYNGWDHSELETVTQSTVIHHPSKDIKKISKSSVAPYKTSVPFNGENNCQVWRVEYWENGTTEGGSSGSPLFDQNKRVIGVLTGGTAGCSSLAPNNGYDVFGRFGYAWNTLADSAQQLQCWLDPTHTGATFIDGVYLDDNSSVLDLSLTELPWLTSVICEVPNPYLIIRNAGNEIVTSAELKYAFNNDEQLVNWSGTLNPYESDTIYFPFPTFDNETVIFTAEILTVNGTTDMGTANNFYTQSFAYSYTQEPVEFEFGYDYYTSEISWSLYDVAHPITAIYHKSYLTDGVASPFILKDCFPVSCYQLKIHDNYGDGWDGSDHPSGYLKIKNRNGDVIAGFDASQSNFGSDTIIEFCLQSLSVDEIVHDEVKLYPNPSHHQFTLQSPANLSIDLVRIYSTSGQLIKEIDHPAESSVWVIQHQLQSGIYLVEIQTSQGQIMKQMVVQ